MTQFKAFDTPEAVEVAFYQAFTTVDIDRMALVWSERARVLCIHPGGDLLQGRNAVLRSWQEIFSGSTPPLVEVRFIEGFETNDIAVRLVEERIRPRDKPPEATNRVLATNVYLREGNSWRLVEHHASLPLMDRSESAGGERRLH